MTAFTANYYRFKNVAICSEVFPLTSYHIIDICILHRIFVQPQSNCSTFSDSLFWSTNKKHYFLVLVEN